MASTPKKNPGAKPEYQIVEHNLHCQTDEGEVILDLRLPIAKLETMMTMEKLEIEDRDLPRFMLDNIMHPEDKAAIEGMRDGIKGYSILMKYLGELTKRLGAGLGESQGSTDESESTEPPSRTTSDASTA